MRYLFLGSLLSGLAAQAQFGPAATSTSASLGPAPTESVGCRQVDGAWECAGARSTASSTAGMISSSSAGTPTTSLTSSGVPPPPTESVGCVLHVDHYHCEGPASGYTASPTTTGDPTIPSPTESSNCFWHETHWDCFNSVEEMEEAESAEDSGTCIIHGKLSPALDDHGDCSAEDLACGAVLLEDFNMGLHVGGLFIILVTSGLGAMIPLFTGWARRRRDSSESLDTLNTSGSEHIAFGRNAGLWANIFFIAKHFGTGVILSTAFIHLLYHGFVMFANECIGHMSFESTAPAIALAAAFVTFLFDFIGSRSAHKKYEHPAGASSPGDEKGLPNHDHSHDGHDHGYDLVLEGRQNWEVVLLELGIIFHSIMIGVTLGAGSGNGWTTLLIVIVFHQFFEGFGIAIGIGVRKSFSQNGKASLLSVGILNSISAGILLYAAFRLLSCDFTDGPLRDAKAYKIIVAICAMMAGMVGMSVLGKWA
ncbi:uncharacterized protein IL334_005154 [Kwoniella shivajii]|uniref:Solute carrier family 39 (Zinc transporter), member 1/2/3 n=1 Tax=Kwoniella shivajii TaxID=564305 RepID=A0ABZ1D4B4_9TREE|nr:hypothetical protein IL334_005154 [Kwoniella shivajii]